MLDPQCLAEMTPLHAAIVLQPRLGRRDRQTDRQTDGSRYRLMRGHNKCAVVSQVGGLAYRCLRRSTPFTVCRLKPPVDVSDYDAPSIHACIHAARLPCYDRKSRLSHVGVEQYIMHAALTRQHHWMSSDHISTPSCSPAFTLVAPSATAYCTAVP